MSKRIKDITVVPKSVPIQRTDLSTFDDSFSFLKERFAAEMQRMEEEMNRFSVNLLSLYGQQGGSQATQASGTTTWDALANSPLITGEGTDKMLKLQFDLSSFDPGEVRIDVVDNKLVVQAHHEQKTPNSEATRELRREFALPRGTDTSTIVSSLSRDGVLTVQVHLPPLIVTEETKPTKGGKNVLSKNPMVKTHGLKRNRNSADNRAQNPIEDTSTLNAPTVVTAQVPQSPMSPKSPASTALPGQTAPTTITMSPASPPPTTLPTGVTSPTSTPQSSPPPISTPQKTSKTPSKTGK